MVAGQWASETGLAEFIQVRKELWLWSTHPWGPHTCILTGLQQEAFHTPAGLRTPRALLSAGENASWFPLQLMKHG